MHASGCVFFLMPANGRPCRSTGRGGTGIVSGAPGGKPCGTVTARSRPSVNFIRKTEPGIAPGGTWIVNVSGGVGGTAGAPARAIGGWGAGAAS